MDKTRRRAYLAVAIIGGILLILKIVDISLA